MSSCYIGCQINLAVRRDSLYRVLLYIQNSIAGNGKVCEYKMKGIAGYCKSSLETGWLHDPVWFVWGSTLFCHRYWHQPAVVLVTFPITGFQSIPAGVWLTEARQVSVARSMGLHLTNAQGRIGALGYRGIRLGLEKTVVMLVALGHRGIRPGKNGGNEEFYDSVSSSSLSIRLFFWHEVEGRIEMLMANITRGAFQSSPVSSTRFLLTSAYPAQNVGWVKYRR